MDGYRLVRSFLFFTLTGCITLSWAGTASAGEAYYVIVYGSQRIPNNPRYAHTFATFVHACWEGDGECPENPKIEEHTISWLACRLKIKLLAHPECGCNIPLHDTIEWALANGERVSLWGAYRCSPELYYAALKQIDLLNSGQVRYKADDAFYRNDRVSNCIHGLSAVVGGYRVRVLSPGWGESASYTVLKRMRPWIENQNEVHAWVGSALGLDEFPLIYRDFTNPRSGALVGPVYRLLGGERNMQATYGPPVR